MSQPLQPEQMHQLMSSNPLFDEAEKEAPAALVPALAPQPSLQGVTPGRNPPRSRQAQPIPEALQSLPHNAHLNFHPTGFRRWP